MLLISGSTREQSSNSAALRSIHEMDIDDIHTVFDDRLVASLPHFDPDLDNDAPPESVTRVRDLIKSADAVLFSTPEYAGSMPGSLKNLLEWTVGSIVMNGKPAAWLKVAAPNRGNGAIAQLEEVLRYIDADLRKESCTSIALDDPAFHESVRQAVQLL